MTLNEDRDNCELGFRQSKCREEPVNTGKAFLNVTNKEFSV